MATLTAVSRVSDVCDLAPGYIRSIAPYQPGKPISELAREMGLEPAASQARIEREPARRQPAAHARNAGSARGLARYPDGNGFELKQRIVAALRCRHGADRARQRLERRARTRGACLSRAGDSRRSSRSTRSRSIRSRRRRVGASGSRCRRENSAHDLDAMPKAVTHAYPSRATSPIRTIRPAPDPQRTSS